MFHLGGPGCIKGGGILTANEMLPNVSEDEPTISLLWSRIPIVGLPPVSITQAERTESRTDEGMAVVDRCASLRGY